MDKNARDTHFQGFARAIMPGLDSLYTLLYRAYATGDTIRRDYYSQRIETLLAQRAYDLAVHVYSCSDWHINPPFDSLEEQVAKIPDMTTFSD